MKPKHSILEAHFGQVLLGNDNALQALVGHEIVPTSIGITINFIILHFSVDIFSSFIKYVMFRRVIVMYKINVISSFPGAHHLNGYPGACQNLHGHNWKIRVQLVTQKTDEIGMAIDFKVVKQHLNELMDKFDHQHLNNLEWFKNQNPTSENIARVIYYELKKAFENEDVTMNEVEVWESDFTSITYSEQ